MLVTDRGGGAGGAWAITLYPAQFRFYFASGEFAGFNVSTSTVYDVGISYDGTGVGNAGRMQAYVAGQPQALGFSGGGVVPASLGTPDNFDLVMFAYGNGKYCQIGTRLDFVRIYDATWNAQEHLDDFNANWASKAFGGGP